MGTCMNTMTRETTNFNTEVQTITETSFLSKYNWNKSINTTASTEDVSSDPVFVIDASIMEKLPTSSYFSIQKPHFNKSPKRVPVVIQRTIKKSDTYNIPKIEIIFVFDTGEQRSEIISNLKHLREISGRLHHLDMIPTFFRVVSDTGSQDINNIPPPIALEVFMSRISSEIENVDAVLVTGYPRNMRDVVEYVTRVQPISGVILLIDPRFHLLEMDDNFTIDTVKTKVKLLLDSIDSSNVRSTIFPVLKFFEQEKLLFVVTLQRTFLEILHDINEIVLSILSRLSQSLTQENTSTEKENLEFELANQKEIWPLTDTLPSSDLNKTFDGKMTSEKQSQSIKYSNLQQSIFNKDVQDVLSLVQARSIMERVTSVNAKSKKK